MDIKVSLPLEQALDLCWQTMAECFNENELLIKQELISKYFKPCVKDSKEKFDDTVKTE
jgi:V/A-type H+-transporting ATPase subunit B